MAKEWIWPPDGDNVPEWATEETQAQVLSVLQKSHGVSGKEKKTRDDLEKAAKKEIKTTQKMVNALEDVAEMTSTLVGTIATTRGQFQDLVPVVDAFGQKFKKLAGSFAEMIPFVGDGAKALIDVSTELFLATFSVTSTILDQVAEGYRETAAQGAIFSGSIEGMITSATSAMIPIENLGETLTKNQVAISTFGDASKGAGVILDHLADLQTEYGNEFARLGLTFEEINDTAGNFYSILARGGQAQLLDANNRQLLTAATAQYTKNLVVLSKLTGRQRQDLEADIRAQMERGNIMAATALLEGKNAAGTMLVFEQMQGVLTSMSPQLADAFSSIATLGVASAESEALLATMPAETRAAMMDFHKGLEDGTLKPEDANRMAEGILDSISKGITNPQFLELAKLGTEVTGPYLQMLAKLVETGLPLAQAFQLGEKSLADLAEDVDKLGTSTDDQTAELMTAQRTLAEFPLKLQEAIASTGAFSTAVDSVIVVVKTMEKALLNIFGGNYEDVKNVAISTDDGVVYVTAKQAIIMEEEGTGTKAQTTTGSLGETIVQVPAEHAKAWEDTVIKAVNAFGAKTPAGIALWRQYHAKMITNKHDLNAFIDQLNEEHGTKVQHFQKGTPGIVDFMSGTLAMLHGKEAVIPAPEGTIPVDLGDSLKPLEDLLANIKNNAGTGNNLLAQDGVNSVQSKQVVSKLEEMVGVLKTIADGQHIGTSTTQRELKKLGNFFAADLFR